MSVNGTGKDRRTGKPLPDSTTWTVKTPAGEVLTDPKNKPLTSVTAEVAFNAVQSYLRRGIFSVAVRS